MLYREFNKDIDQSMDSYIFNTDMYNEDINIADIAALEKFYKNNNYIPEKYISMFLNYFVYYIRKNICNGIDSPLVSSLAGRCSQAACIASELAEKFGFEAKQFNVGDVFDVDRIHQLCIISIPTMIDGEIISNDYIIDPTFKQFCLEDENRFERYFEEPRWAVKMSTPHPGYFMKLTDDGTKFAEDLIYDGYFQVNDNSIKTYFDAFALYLTPAEEYEHDMLGKISSTDTLADDYINRIYSLNDDNVLRSNIQILTPLEIIKNEQNKYLFKLKSIIGRNDDFKSTIDLENNKKMH